MTKKEEKRLQSLADLRRYYEIKEGQTIYTFLKSVSSSGMSRQIAVIVSINGEVRNISRLVAEVLELRLNKSLDAITIGGAGMDMGYSIVYGLSRTLFKDSFYCIGDNCPSNDHVNGDREYNHHQHSDGGYALRHSWL